MFSLLTKVRTLVERL